MTGADQPADEAAALLRDDEQVPMLTSASWQQAEAKLYPAVTTRPDIYQRVLTIVRLTVDRLRALGPSTGALLAAAARGPELVCEVMSDNGLSAHELDVDLLARAALAMRHREAVAEQKARHRLRLIAAAHRAGQDWVVLEEGGFADGDPFAPYTRFEAQVATGRALLVTARGDEDFRSVVHAVEELRIDLRTGDVEEAADGSAAATTHHSGEARETRVAELRSVRGSA